MLSHIKLFLGIFIRKSQIMKKKMLNTHTHKNGIKIFETLCKKIIFFDLYVFFLKANIRPDCYHFFKSIQQLKNYNLIVQLKKKTANIIIYVYKRK